MSKCFKCGHVHTHARFDCPTDAPPSTEKVSQWIRGSLPSFNKLVVAFLIGHKEHPGVTWRRNGFAFMVRHNDGYTVADEWSRDRYDRALIDLDADWLEVYSWMPLERPNV